MTFYRDHKAASCKRNSTLLTLSPQSTDFLKNTKSSETDGKYSNLDLSPGSIFELSGYTDAKTETKNMARIPEQNSFPVLRLAAEGAILFSSGLGSV